MVSSKWFSHHTKPAGSYWWVILLTNVSPHARTHTLTHHQHHCRFCGGGWVKEVAAAQAMLIVSSHKVQVSLGVFWGLLQECCTWIRMRQHEVFNYFLGFLGGSVGTSYPGGSWPQHDVPALELICWLNNNRGGTYTQSARPQLNYLCFSFVLDFFFTVLSCRKDFCVWLFHLVPSGIRETCVVGTVCSLWGV